MAELEKNVFCDVREPLRQYTLEHLPAVSLARLRQVNTFAQLLVDQNTGSVWRAAASALLGPGCLPGTDDADVVQRTLREQGTLLQMLRAGGQHADANLSKCVRQDDWDSGYPSQLPIVSLSSKWPVVPFDCSIWMQ